MMKQYRKNVFTSIHRSEAMTKTVLLHLELFKFPGPYLKTGNIFL